MFGASGRGARQSMSATERPYEAPVWAIREQAEEHLQDLGELSILADSRPLHFNRRNTAWRSLRVLVKMASGLLWVDGASINAASAAGESGFSPGKSGCHQPRWSSHPARRRCALTRVSLPATATPLGRSGLFIFTTVAARSCGLGDLGVRSLSFRGIQRLVYVRQQVVNVFYADGQANHVSRHTRRFELLLVQLAMGG